MPLAIVPHADDLAPLVGAFNQRLLGQGVPYRFPESPISPWLPRRPDRRIFRELFVATDGAAVRGGYILKHQRFLLNSEQLSVGNYQLPLTEGTIAKEHAPVGLALLLHALRQQPLLYALGIGSHEESLTKLLRAAGWSIATVPFLFRVLHPRAFLRHIRPLRRTRARRVGLDLAAATGLGSLTSLGHGLASAWARRGHARPAHTFDVVPGFDSWVDDVLTRGGAAYRFAAVRDAETLAALYPEADPRFHRLRVRRSGEDIGWAVCLATSMRDHAFFGDMRVGTLVDCFAVVGHEAAVAHAATSHLAALRADLAISNQSHHRWQRALAEAGFLGGPSNFLFAASKRLAGRLLPFAAALPSIHLTRGDGDGPIHL